MSINPDFRTIENVEPPLSLEHSMGWRGDYESEQKALDKLEADFPVAFRTHTSEPPMPAVLKKWTEFQKSKGRYEGSADWSLLDEFVWGKPLLWKPQIIGSCVVSNTFRAYHIRQMYQIVLLGRAEEYFGREEFGPENFAFYGPWTYGMARKRANMRGGDGLYCEPMAASMMKDGVLTCSTPKLRELLQAKGLNSAEDFPEPQGRDGASLYRAFGDWQYLDHLKPYADFPVLESVRVTNGDQLWDLLQAGKPSFVCSMEAIHKVGEHRDGFPIHARNPRDRWAHNMAFHGAFLASDGERFIRQSNESWGAQHIYNRRLVEVDGQLKRGGLTCMSIGEIRGPASSPPL